MTASSRSCAWCGAVIPARGGRGGSGASTSHGICAECLSNTGEFPVLSSAEGTCPYPPLGILRVDAQGTVQEYREDRSTALPTPDLRQYVGREIAEVAEWFGLRPSTLAPVSAEHRTDDVIFRYESGAVLIEIEVFCRAEQRSTYLVWRAIQ